MHRSSTTYAIIFYILLAILVVLIAHGILSGAEHMAMREFQTGKLVIAQETLHGIQSLVASAQDYVQYLAAFPKIQKLDEPATREMMQTLFKSANNIIASITRVDSTGKIRITIPYSEYEGTDITYQEHIKRLLKSHQPVIGGPLKIVQGFDAVVIHIPTLLNDSIFTGSIAAIIAFDSLKSRFIAPISKNPDEVVWLANANGKILCHPKYHFGKRLDEVYSNITDQNLSNFLSNFPTKNSGSLTYMDMDNKVHILCWYCERIGFERWVLGIDVKKNIALSSFVPLKKKIIISSILALLLALVGVFATLRLAERKSIIEQQKKFLTVANFQREKLDYILKFAQELLTVDINTDVTPRIAESAKSLYNAPFAMEWIYNKKSNELIPGYSFIDDYRITEELRSSGIDIAQIPLPTIIDDLDLSELSGHIILPVSKFSAIAPQWTIIIHSIKSIHPFENFIVIPLSTKEKFFACIVIPEDKGSSIQAELLESFRISVSQSLYIRSILGELIANNRINQDILNTVDKAIFLVDSRFTILSASPVFYNLYEVKGKAIGRNLFEVVPFLRDLHLEEVYREVMKTKTSRETEETYIASDRKRRFTQTKIIPISDEGKQVKRLLTIVDDVTEFRLLEEKLQRTADELSQKNHQLEKLAITDELTQLRNYRYFIEQLPIYISKHRSEEAEMSLISMDLDDFKRYNDTYGHPAGDKLLMEIADIVRGFIRSGDLGARYGGDEFVMILTDTDLFEAQDVAERLCRRISQALFMGEKGTRNEHITASIGIAVLTDDVADDEELLRRADTALYVSKRKGRNRVTIYSADVES